MMIEADHQYNQRPFYHAGYFPTRQAPPPIVKTEQLETYNLSPLYQPRSRFMNKTWPPLMMDVVTDPQLAQYNAFNPNNVAFPNDPATAAAAGFDTSGFLGGYGLTTSAGQEQQQSFAASPVQSSNTQVSSPRGSVRNNNVGRSAGQASPAQAAQHNRLRGQQQRQQPHVGIPQHSPATTDSSSPRRVTNPHNQPSKGGAFVFKNSTSSYPRGGATMGPAAENENMYVPVDKVGSSSNMNGGSFFAEPEAMDDVSPIQEPTQDSANPFSDTFPLVTDPANLETWRDRLFNVEQPLHLSEAQFLTYFPHVDNVYSHRSTQKYKKKPFVSHYWDCRLKGRPSGTKKSDDPNKKKRKREKRARDLCDVKIKITEWFGVEERLRLGLDETSLTGEDVQLGQDGLNVIIEGHEQEGNFGMLEPSKKLPAGHPGADGKRWFTIQRVNGSANSTNNQMHDMDNDDEDESNLDHKHSLEDSDRIKKNSVQRYLLKQEKENKQSKRTSTVKPANPYPNLLYYASGLAAQTTKLHKSPTNTHLTFYGNAFCPFSQRIWIALEIKSIPYQYVEVIPSHMLNSANTTSNPLPKDVLDICPEALPPCIKHGNWGIWESGIMLEYLEDLTMGVPLLPVGNPQLRAHCRLWVDHVNRKILPAFYALLLTPPPSSSASPNAANNTATDLNLTNATSLRERHSLLITTLQTHITSLVNASHAVGPYFLGPSISYVDVAFAPWIIRLSRVLSHYRHFPRPEVGTRWQRWVDAVESDERVRRTVSSEEGYHAVYGGVAEEGWCLLTSNENKAAGKNGNVGGGDGGRGASAKKAFMEIQFAKKVLMEEGFGAGGDVFGHLGLDPQK